MQALAEILVYGWIFALAYFIGFILDLFQRVALDNPAKKCRGVGRVATM